MEPTAFKQSWRAVVERERAEAKAAGVPEVADDLLLITAPQSALANPLLPPSAAEFLVEAGLPGSTAPFLTFNAVVKGPLTLPDYYRFPRDDSFWWNKLNSFYVIGFDGYGSPICLSAGDGGVIFWLDHDDKFQGKKFVASSVNTLAAALLTIYTQPHRDFVAHVARFDPPAVGPGSFLPDEVRQLID